MPHFYISKLNKYFVYYLKVSGDGNLLSGFLELLIILHRQGKHEMIEY